MHSWRTRRWLRACVPISRPNDRVFSRYLKRGSARFSDGVTRSARASDEWATRKIISTIHAESPRISFLIAPRIITSKEDGVCLPKDLTTGLLFSNKTSLCWLLRRNASILWRNLFRVCCRVKLFNKRSFRVWRVCNDHEPGPKWKWQSRGCAKVPTAGMDVDTRRFEFSRGLNSANTTNGRSLDRSTWVLFRKVARQTSHRDYAFPRLTLSRVIVVPPRRVSANWIYHLARWGELLRVGKSWNSVPIKFATSVIRSRNSPTLLTNLHWQLIADHNEWPNRTQQSVALFLNSSVWYQWIEIVEK